MRKILILGIVFVLLLACVGAVSANLIVNGGFETPAITGDFSTYNAVDSTLSPWTVDLGSIDHIHGYWTAAEGSQSIDLAGNTAGTISQKLVTDPSKGYELNFALSGNPDSSADKKVEIWWDGNLVQTFTFVQTGTRSLMDWSAESLSLPEPKGTLTELKFVDVSGTTFFGAALDDIIVEEEGNNIPVPEFPTIALPVALIVGILGAVLFIQKSREN
jgi:choice-of-anchor C domain-containing protein